MSPHGSASPQLCSPHSVHTCPGVPPLLLGRAELCQTPRGRFPRKTPSLLPVAGTTSPDDPLCGLLVLPASCPSSPSLSLQMSPGHLVGQERHGQHRKGLRVICCDCCALDTCPPRTFVLIVGTQKGWDTTWAGVENGPSGSTARPAAAVGVSGLTWDHARPAAALPRTLSCVLRCHRCRCSRSSR